MQQLKDDPIISSIERTGYPPWIDADYEEIKEDSYHIPFAVYDPEPPEVDNG